MNGRCGTAAAGLELQGLHQAGGDDLHRLDHAFALKPDFGFGAADVVTGKLDSIPQAQHIGMRQRANEKKRQQEGVLHGT